MTNPDATPSSSLKFDVINHGTSGLTNIVLEISILEHRRHAESDGPPRVLVQPFMIRETVVLQPGYSMEYELRLRNLSADDGGEARVAVVSLESRPDSR